MDPSLDDTSLLSNFASLRLRHHPSAASSRRRQRQRRHSNARSSLASRHRAVAPADFHDTPPPSSSSYHHQRPPDPSPKQDYMERSGGGGGGGGGGLLSAALACLCRPRQTFAIGSSSSASVTAAAATALLHQSRLQLQALEAMEETRDMWEWQMEQQQELASQEHEFLEKQYSSGAAAAAYMQSPLISLARSSSARRQTPDSAAANSAAAQRRRRYDDFSKSFVVDDSSSSPAPPPYSSPASLFADRISLSSSTTTSSGGAASPPPPPPLDLYRHLSDPGYAAAISVLFEGTLLRCRSEINLFCRIYMQQMVLSGYSLVKTLTEMEAETVFVRRVHASYALESRICSVMFRCFENDSFDDTGLTQILDQEARAATRLHEFFAMKSMEAEAALAMGGAAYDAGFHHYCAAKSEEVAEMGGGWRMSYRSEAERDRFMEAFLRAAKSVWMLHRLANATNPPVNIIRVARGMQMHPNYVEAAALLKEPPPQCRRCNVCAAAEGGGGGGGLPKVQFMVMPGFVSATSIFKAWVYPHYMCGESPEYSSESSPAVAASSICSS